MTTVVRDVEMIDVRHYEASSRVDIAIDAGRITSVGPSVAVSGAKNIDGRGQFALPGLINAHDHLYSHELRTPIPELGLAGMRAYLDARSPVQTVAVMIRNAVMRLREGIAVVRDLGSNHGVNVEVASIFDSGVIPGPVVLPAGRPVVMTGGHVYSFGREANGPWECREAVREQAKAHAKVIKIMASGGVSRYPDEDFGLAEFSSEELAAIVDEARHRGLPTCAHAFGDEAVRRALDAGVDSIEHGVRISPADLARMAGAGTSYVPTLSNMRRVADIALAQANAMNQAPHRYEELTAGVVEPHSTTFQAALAAGVKIGVGTDSTGEYGTELATMVELGMTVGDAIRAATVDGADICRIDAGVLEVGKLGSVLLYSTDPRDDIGAITRPSTVIHRGVVLDDGFWDGWGASAD